MVIASSAADSPAICSPKTSAPLAIKLLSRKPTLGDHFVALAFLLCVSGLVWLLWDQQRLLQ